MLCPHGINLKHRRCDACEETAKAEGSRSCEIPGCTQQRSCFHYCRLHHRLICMARQEPDILSDQHFTMGPEAS
jgi:hypothetical protein